LTASPTQLPTVSVVIATRDRPELLLRAVRSVFDQAYAGDIELVLVFDQSEPSRPAVEERPGRLLRMLTNERHPGLAGARNTGVLAAEGELVAFCDDDDEWLPGKLDLQVAALEAHPESATASGGIVVHYNGKTFTRLAGQEVVTFEDLLRSRRTEIHPSTFLVRRAALLDGVGLVDESIPGSYAEDYEWMLRAARQGGIVAVDAPVANVYWHTSSFFAGRWQTIAASLRYLLHKYPEFQQDPKGLARIEGQLAFAYAASGQRAEARVWAARTLRANLRQPRAYLALLISFGLLQPGTVQRLAHRTGRGI
jgi:glycosyltransferase involved in cell wall biosynthesis